MGDHVMLWVCLAEDGWVAMWCWVAMCSCGGVYYCKQAKKGYGNNSLNWWLDLPEIAVSVSTLY